MKRSVVNAIDASLLLLVVWTAWRVAVGFSATSERTTFLPGAANTRVVPVAVGGAFAPGKAVARQGLCRIVLVLSEHCGACRQSVGFYRRLSDAVATQSSRGPAFGELVAVTADLGDTMRRWLWDNGIAVTELVHVKSLAALGVRATPTVMIVGRDDRITDVIVGRLSPPEEELLVRRAIGIETGVRLDRALVASTITEPDTRRMVLEQGAVVLDVRERIDFKVSNLPVRNIPLDELRERMLVELDRTRPVIVDCRVSEADSCELAAAILLKEKFVSAAVLVR